MRAWIRSRFGGDEGFSLVELVVAVAILGIIVVGLVGVVLSYLRNMVDTEARLTESHDVQFAAAYWQRDVASIGVRSATYDPSSHTFPLEQSVDVAPCPAPAGTTSVVTLAWSEYSSLSSSDPPPTVRVTYATRAAGSVHELYRVRCGSQPSTVELADSLVAVPTVVCQDVGGAATPCSGTADDVPAVVKLGLSVHDSSGRNTTTYDVTLVGQRRQT